MNKLLRVYFNIASGLYPSQKYRIRKHAKYLIFTNNVTWHVRGVNFRTISTEY